MADLTLFFFQILVVSPRWWADVRQVLKDSILTLLRENALNLNMGVVEATPTALLLWKHASNNVVRVIIWNWVITSIVYGKKREELKNIAHSYNFGLLCLNDFNPLFSDCPQICTEQYAPVCGSDKKTYGNTCKFNAAKCKAAKAGKTIKIAYKGKCKTGVVEVKKWQWFHRLYTIVVLRFASDMQIGSPRTAQPTNTCFPLLSENFQEVHYEIKSHKPLIFSFRLP